MSFVFLTGRTVIKAVHLEEKFTFLCNLHFKCDFHMYMYFNKESPISIQLSWT